MSLFIEIQLLLPSVVSVDLGVDGRAILKLILKIVDGVELNRETDLQASIKERSY
jgi:hypothetical protein